MTLSSARTVCTEVLWPEGTSGNSTKGEGCAAGAWDLLGRGEEVSLLK